MKNSVTIQFSGRIKFLEEREREARSKKKDGRRPLELDIKSGEAVHTLTPISFPLENSRASSFDFAYCA